MRLVFTVTTLERHITIYVYASLVNLMACIFSRMFKHVLNVKNLSCMQVAIYVRASSVSLFVCIFSYMLSLALEQHASFQKNVTEMNASLMRACVKFRLSYIVCKNITKHWQFYPKIQKFTPCQYLFVYDIYALDLCCWYMHVFIISELYSSQLVRLIMQIRTYVLM